MNLARRAYHRANSTDPYSNNVEMMPTGSRYKDGKNSYSIRADESPMEHDSDTPSDSKHVHHYSVRSIDQDRLPFAQPPSTAKRFVGWRAGAYSAASIALASLIINIAAAIWLKKHPNAKSNLVEVYNGDCKMAANMDIWVHLLINAVSTLLLGGSNYCMQCLCAPTRLEIDKAHAKGQYLDIAVPSYHNLSYIAWSRRILWWVLAFSSLPLHLVYNSAFYTSMAANDYAIYFVTPDFLQGGNATYSYPYTDSDYYAENVHVAPEDLQRQIASNQTHKFEQLDPLGCIKSYAHDMLTGRRNLVFVLKNDTTLQGSTVVDAFPAGYGADFWPYQWICNGDPQIWNKTAEGVMPCSPYIKQVEAVADQWSPFGHEIDYCLSEIVEENCSFNGNLPIVIAVIVANAIKAIVMLTVAYCLRNEPLITIGDAISSFLNVPDETTREVCYLTRDQATKYTKLRTKGSRSTNDHIMEDIRAGNWKGIQKIEPEAQFKSFKVNRWSKAGSTRRWILTIGAAIATIVTTAGLLVPALKNVMGDITLLDFGFGTITRYNVIDGWFIDNIADPATRILAAILIANLPQTILSFLYLNLNGLVTGMFTALEWSNFATERKPLRVSTPQGQQRSTYFLQLPYKVAVPFMTISGILHWLVSRTIFLAVVAEYGQIDGDFVDPFVLTSCGFSPIAMIAVIVMGVLIVGGCFVIGRFKYDPSMPLAGSCSVAISAACHRPDWDVDARFWPVQWGVIPDSDEATGIGHCSFTSGPVEPVQEGREYA